MSDPTDHRDPTDPTARPVLPDLRRLRDEAKRRKRAGEFDTLAAAQFAIAREHDFSSWPRLKTFVETRALDRSARAALLVRTACSADLRTARTLLDAEPDLVRHDLATACVTGEVDEVIRRLDRDAAAVHRPLAPVDWQPILLSTFSRFLRAEPARAEGIVAVVRVLLDRGADPNVFWMDDEFRELPIFGAAGIANNADLTRLLLDAGADPNETYDDDTTIGEALYHAAEFTDPTCARLLMEAGTSRHRISYCLGRALDFPNEPMVDAFLEHGAKPTSRQLRKAIAFGRPMSTIRKLVEAGASVQAADDDGVTALRLAVRRGRDELAEVLVAGGADGSKVTDADRWCGAVVSGEDPGAAVPDAAASAEVLEWAAHVGDVEVVRRLLDAGVAVDGRGEERPLSQAAWRGHAGVVEELVAHGASLEWDDGSPIGATLHGALHCHDPQGGPTMGTEHEIDHGDYPAVLRILLAAGAVVPTRLWDPDLDVDDLLARFGVAAE